MDIEALATEAGADTAWDVWRTDTGELRISMQGVGITEELEKFALLVAATEREACAKLCDVLAKGSSEGNLHVTRSAQEGCAEAIRMRSSK